MFFCKNTENGTAENFRHPTNCLQLSHHVVHAVHAGLLIHQERRRTQSARSKHAAVLRAMADADSLARAKEADFMLARDRAAAQGVHPDFLMLALPCHAQVNAEKLKQDGIGACLLKPLTPTRLLPALTEFCHHKQNTLLPVTDESKLAMTVMAVDDNPANLKLIGALLEDMEQHVELCDSGHQAVERAKQMPFDLILMDIQMPDMDGIRACELIHQLPHQQQTPVIAVTAHAMAGQKEKLLGAGMSDYLAKPIEEERLHNLLLRYKPGSGISSRVVTPEVNEIVVNQNATLDWQLALRQAAGKTDLARDMLQM